MANPMLGIYISSALGAKALINYLTMPLLIPNFGSSVKFSSLLSKFAGVPVWPETYTMKAPATSGKQVVIRSGGAERITDNYLPEPRVWTIDGYLKGVSFTLTSLLSTMQIPTKGSLVASSVVTKAASGALLQLYINILENMRQSRTPFTFRTSNGELVSSLLIDFQINETAEIENVKAVHLVVEEFLGMELLDGTQLTLASKSVPESGSIFGNPTSIGVAAGISAVKALGAYTALAFMQEANLASTDATYNEKTQKIVETKPPVRTTNNKSASFASFFNTMQTGDTFYYAELPSTVISTTQADGTVVYYDNFNVTINNMGGTLYLTVARDLDSLIWRLTEKYVVAGEVLFESSSLLAFNSIMHSTSEVYSMCFLVVTVPEAPVSPSTVVAEPDPGDYPAGKEDPAYILALAEYIQNQTLWTTYKQELETYSAAFITAFSTCKVALIRKNA